MQDDRARENDGCTLSSSWERRCQTDEEGKLRCETLKRTWRRCPGRAPEELSSEHLVGDPEMERPPSIFSPRPGPHESAGGFGVPGGFFGEIDQLTRQMEAMMGAAFGGAFDFGSPRGLGGGFGSSAPGSTPGMQQQPHQRMPATGMPSTVQVDEV